MKKLFTILMLIPILLLGQNELNAKIDLSMNNIYAELHIGLFTQVVLNYERQIYLGEKVSWYGRLGLGYGGMIDGIDGGFGGWGGLGAITMLTGKKNNHFELNAGSFFGYNAIDWFEVDKDEPFIFPIFNVGYRYQKPDGGFIFRANAGIISLGLSIGYAF